jgi:hypothetical protein
MAIPLPISNQQRSSYTGATIQVLGNIYVHDHLEHVALLRHPLKNM